LKFADVCHSANPPHCWELLGPFDLVNIMGNASNFYSGDAFLFKGCLFFLKGFRESLRSDFWQLAGVAQTGVSVAGVGSDFLAARWSRAAGVAQLESGVQRCI
jgi:hypothetical protein